MSPPFEIIRELPGGSQACRVDLIRYEAGVAVCKTFNCNDRQKHNNELNELSMCDDFEEIAEILNYGDNWILIQYYDNMQTMAELHGFHKWLIAQKA